MKAKELRRRFIDFFVKKHNHAEIQSASLIPENDPTVLFTTAGMHPLVPYLMGEVHPSGKRLVNVQKCVRTDDIEEVGDSTHCTFFEMLGNWSLGDYFKKETVEWSHEFLTGPLDDGCLGMDPDRLMITCFAGDDDAPRDDEAATAWERLGYTRYDKANPGDKKLIFFYEKKKNWWGPAGHIGPCGPDTEMFYDLHPELPSNEHKPGATESLTKKYVLKGRPGEATGRARSEGGSGEPGSPNGSSESEPFGVAKGPEPTAKIACHPNCECGRYVEIWNDVFMQYNKMPDGKYEPLKQQNVDTGMGFERVLAILQGVPSHYETELFLPLKEKIKELAAGAGSAGHGSDAGSATGSEKWTATGSGAGPATAGEPEQIVSARIIADHIRAAAFILGDPWGVSPSNKDQGYVLRRLIRRAIRHAKMLGITGNFTHILGQIVIDIYGDTYSELIPNGARIIDEFRREEAKFQKTILQGLREMKKIWNEDKCKKELAVENGDKAFYVYETYGFPVEMIKEELGKMGYHIDEKRFAQKFEAAHKAHQELSRAGSEMKFAGGLADHSFECTMLHTATHLLHQALRTVLGDHVYQKGSNITAERLRFDFNHPEKMTPEQVKKVEDIVNEQIQRDLVVSYEIVTVPEAKQKGAIGVFPDRYDEKVKVYRMGDFSYEICGGPHVTNTGVLKKFKITKEEACSAGIRRIKAVVIGAGLKE